MSKTTRRASRRGAAGDSARATSSFGLRAWLVAREWPRWLWLLALTLIFALAVAARLSFQARVAHSLLADTLRADELVYWRWSGGILRNGPVGHTLWFFGPLYPYLLAVLRLCGAGLRDVMTVQAVWGSVAAVLLADAARRLSRPGLGVLVGVFAAVYPMAVFFDSLLLAESPLFALEALLLWLVVRSDRAPVRWRVALAVGGLIGLLAEGRGTSVLLLVPAAVGFVPWSLGRRNVGVALGGVLLGCLFVVMPVALRNAYVSGSVVPFTYNFGFNLWVGQGPDATGTWVTPTGFRSANRDTSDASEGGIEGDGREYLRSAGHRDLGQLQSSDYFAGLVAREIAAHRGRALRLFVRKVGLVWNRVELPQIESFDEFRHFAGDPGWRFLGGFATLAVLGLAATWAAWRRGRSGRFLCLYLLVTTLGVAVFFVTDRYRFHLVPALLLLGALGIEDLVRAPGTARGRALIVYGLGAALGAALAWAPLTYLGGMQFRASLHADMGVRWLQQGRPDIAVGEFERALALLADTTARATHPRDVQTEVGLYFNYAVALEQTGRSDSASVWYSRVLRENPTHPGALRSMVEVERRRGNAQVADSLTRALALAPGGAASAIALDAWAAAQAGNYADAEAAFARALRMDSHLYNEWAALIRLQLQGNRFAAAESTLALARDAGLPRPTLRAYQALFAALHGQRMDAEAALADVPRELIDADPTLAQVVQMTRKELARR